MYGLIGFISRLRFLLGALGIGQLGPDGLPVVWAKLLKARAWVDLVEIASKGGRSSAQTLQYLIEILLIDRQRRGDFSATFGGVVWKGHANDSSESLAFVKLFAS